MFSPQTPVLSYLRLAYFTRLPGDAHSASRATYEREIAKLDRHFRARQKALEAERQKLPEPERSAVSEYQDRAVELGDLCGELLEWAMCREVESGNTVGTANKLYRHVKSVWNFAACSESRGGPVLTTRICATKRYKEPKRKKQSWYPEEVEAIVFAAATMSGFVGDVPANVFWPAMLLTNISTAVRINAHMRTPTVNWCPHRAQIVVPAEVQKQDEDQVFDLYPSANDCLKRLAPHERGLSTLFGDWPYDEDGHWITLRKHLKKILVRAGLFAKVEDVTRWDLFHKFRRTVATEIAIAKGLSHAQKFLGHSSASVTQGYIDERRIERVKMRDVAADPGAKIQPQLRLFEGDAGDSAA